MDTKRLYQSALILLAFLFAACVLFKTTSAQGSRNCSGEATQAEYDSGWTAQCGERACPEGDSDKKYCKVERELATAFGYYYYYTCVEHESCLRCGQYRVGQCGDAGGCDDPMQMCVDKGTYYSCEYGTEDDYSCAPECGTSGTQNLCATAGGCDPGLRCTQTDQRDWGCLDLDDCGTDGISCGDNGTKDVCGLAGGCDYGHQECVFFETGGAICEDNACSLACGQAGANTGGYCNPLDCTPSCGDDSGCGCKFDSANSAFRCMCTEGLTCDESDPCNQDGTHPNKPKCRNACDVQNQDYECNYLHPNSNGIWNCYECECTDFEPDECSTTDDSTCYEECGDDLGSCRKGNPNRCVCYDPSEAPGYGRTVTIEGIDDTTIKGYFTSIYTILLSIAIATGVFLIGRAGYLLATSQGDPARVKAGQEWLTSAIIGLIFAVLAMTILRVVLSNIIYG